MSATIDHLRTDHRVTILREFTDAAGITMDVGQDGILRGLSFDQIRLEIRIEIECGPGRIVLVFPLTAKTGPRNGHMKEFFELGDYVPVPGAAPVRRNPSERTMIVPPRDPILGQNVDDLDRLEDVEKAMRQDVQHIGVAASIAEMYAQRMRTFQRAGNEPRAIAAFKLAVDWMGTYASWATSGGEGAALSYERDRFHAALVREFGYDPTEEKR